MSEEKPKYIRKKCEHGKYSFQCKECNGSSICEHGKNKYYCKECGGKGFCEHSNIKYTCTDCKGGSICEHNKRRTRCKDCKGGSICEHNKVKTRCKECGGSELCKHNRRKYECIECEGNATCEHKKRRSRCIDCNGSEICEHNNSKYCCVECHGKNICEHNKLKYQCVECKGSKICEHNTRRNICITCSPETACQYCKSVSIISSKWTPYCFRCYCVLNPDVEIKKKFKLKEHYVKDELVEYYKDSLTMTFDKSIQGGCSRKRPDIFIDFGSQCLIIEIDENQHMNYECEQKRMLEIYEDIGFRKVIFIRFNPDGYTYNNNKYKTPFNYTKTGIINIDKKEMKRRIELLIEKIDYYKNIHIDKDFIVEFMFYGDLDKTEYEYFHTNHTS